VKSGYPKSVPYGPDAGEHVVDIQPAADLAPCTNYRVDITAALIDANARAVTPAHWTFRTDGCSDDPGSTTTSSVSPSSDPATSNPSASVSPAAVAAQPVAAVPTFTG
jgi:Bacterial Ig-like domain